MKHTYVSFLYIPLQRWYLSSTATNSFICTTI